MALCAKRGTQVRIDLCVGTGCVVGGQLPIELRERLTRGGVLTRLKLRERERQRQAESPLRRCIRLSLREQFREPRSGRLACIKFECEPTGGEQQLPTRFRAGESGDDVERTARFIDLMRTQRRLCLTKGDGEVQFV